MQKMQRQVGSQITLVSIILTYNVSFFFQYTLSDLLSKVQASKAELLDALMKMEALEIDGEFKSPKFKSDASSRFLLPT